MPHTGGNEPPDFGRFAERMLESSSVVTLGFALGRTCGGKSTPVGALAVLTFGGSIGLDAGIPEVLALSPSFKASITLWLGPERLPQPALLL